MEFYQFEGMPQDISDPFIHSMEKITGDVDYLVNLYHIIFFNGTSEEHE